jgi:hypothetical protein
MFMKSGSRVGNRAFAAIIVLLLGPPMVGAADGVDDPMARLLGREITIESSSLGDVFPVGGKLAFVYDDKEQVVRACTRQASGQDKPWRSDLAKPCGITLAFKKGTRYCTLEDVKTGDAETLASCHRLRSEELALKATDATVSEVHDLLVFLLKSDVGKPVIAILVDSPSRVTTGGIIVGCCSGPH